MANIENLIALNKTQGAGKKMNYGGFSWKRLLGISALKAKISRKIGIPLTQSGRQRKLGALIEKFVLNLIKKNTRRSK